ncbi:MAG: CBS domain-containing protein [Bacteroidota bacterium]
MNLLQTVARIMTTNLKTVRPSDSLMVVRDMFRDFNIHHLPVVSYDKIIGIISKEDYLNFQFGCIGDKHLEAKENFRLTEWKAKHIMTTKLAKLESTDTVRTALEVFKLNRIHALPIVDGDKLVGIITPHDIIKTLAEEPIALADYQTATA